MKTLAKLNTKGFTVQDIIESGFSFEEYDSLVSEVYNKVQVGENESKGFIVESAIPPTFIGDSLYKIFYPLTSTLKGVDTFNYDSGVPSQGGYFPLYNPSKENILVGDTDLKASGIKNAGIFNIEGALSFERVSQENFINVPEDFFNWRSYFYRVNLDNSDVTPIVEKNNIGINDSRENLFQRKSPLGTYDTGVLDSETFGTINDRLIWVIPIKNFSKGSDDFFSFSFYLNKRHSYIKDTDIQFISTKTQITDVDTFRQVMFDNSGVIVLDNLDSTLKNKIVGNTDTKGTFTTGKGNNYYNLVNNEWHRLAVSFDFSDFTTSNETGYYNYIIVRFTPGSTSNNEIPKSSFLQVCAPMFERGCSPSPFEVIREKKNTNSLFEVFYKYPLLFNFNRFNTSLTENILSLSKKWLISYKRKFESTLTTQKGTFIDSLGSIWWGYNYSQDTGNLQVTFSSGTLDINNWIFDPKKVLNKWESVFIYPTEDKKICIEVHLEDGNSYRINTSITEESVPMGTLISDIKYHLNLGGCFEGNILKKYNGYYKDLLFLIESDSNSLDIQKAIKEINSNSLALHSKKVWDKETNKQESATILQTNSLKEGF